MSNEPEAFGVFAYMYQTTNLIRMVQAGRSDPDNVRKLVADALTVAKAACPHLASGLDNAARNFERAIDRGIELRASDPTS